MRKSTKEEEKILCKRMFETLKKVAAEKNIDLQPEDIAIRIEGIDTKHISHLKSGEDQTNEYGDLLFPIHK